MLNECYSRVFGSYFCVAVCAYIHPRDKKDHGVLHFGTVFGSALIVS